MSSGVESLNVPSWRIASTPEGYKPGYSSPCVERKQGSDKSLLLNIPRYNSVDKHATPSLSGKNLNFSPVFNSLPFTHSLSKLSEIHSQTSRYQTLAQHKMAMEFAGMNGVEKLNGALSPSRSSDSPGLLRNILQQKDNLSDPRDNNNVKDISVKHVSDSAKDLEKNGFQDEDKDSLQSGEFSDEDCELEGNKNGLDAENEDDDDDDIVDEYGMMKNGDIESDFGENEEEEEEESKEVKRARLDNILTSMRQSPTNAEQGQNGNGEVRRKRKQYQPKWLEHSDNKVRKMERIALQDQLMQLQHQIQLIQKRYMELAEEESLTPGESMVETRGRDAPIDVSEEVVSSATEKDKAVSSNSKPETSFKLFQPHLDVIKAPKSFPFMGEPKPSMLDSLANRKGKASDLDIQKLSSDLKSHIANAISTSVDTVLKSFVKTDSVPVEKEAEKQRKKEEESFKEVKPKPAIPPPVESDKMPRPIEHKPFIHDSFRHDHIGNIARILEHQAHSAFETPRGFAPDLYRHSHNPLPFPMPPFSCFPPMLHTPSSIYSPAPVVSEPEQTEALPLVVSQTPKKKRTKVTDTRLSPRAARALLQDPMNPHLDLDRHPFASLMPHALPTSVAIPNPSLRNSNVLECYYNGYGFPEPRSSTHSPLDMEHMSPRTNLSSSPTEGLQLKSDSASMDDSYDGQMHMTSTLTPMHLRKAKLMFFYVRYPSSAILKVYFPDVKFNKNNTAQLVKWFSNFREFYYIQMEKYARQAIAEGCKHAEDLVVTVDSELYRVLNLHYNRNNQIEVPDHFRQVVQATLREFYKSIVACKDQEPSWKKAIYKIISRMDNVIPEYFKSPNWMDQLGDM